MCFSASASFVAAGVIGTIGLATLRHVREPRTLLFAAVPLLFAFHQLCEGFDWLGLEGRIGTIALQAGRRVGGQERQGRLEGLSHMRCSSLARKMGAADPPQTPQPHTPHTH